jgi:hypothetical protein
VQGAASAAQDDGQNGVDNSFGENICPSVITPKPAKDRHLKTGQRAGDAGQVLPLRLDLAG